MNIGFIGAGRMTQRRIEKLPKSCRAVAVYDKPGVRADAKLLEPLCVPTAADVIARSDVVVVATPHAYLAGYAADALAEGRTVLVEKPGATKASELVGIDCRVGFNHRFWPGVFAAKKKLTGPILSIRAAYGHGGRPGYTNDWRFDPTLSGGGELIDQGSHLIDLCRFFAGEVTLEHCSLRSSHWGGVVEDNAYLTLGLPDGVAQLHASWTQWDSLFRFEIVTDHECVTVEGFPWESQRCDGRSWCCDDSLGFELLDAIVGGPTGATAEDARATLEIIEQAYG